MSLFEVVLQWVTALLLQTVYLFIRIIYEGFEVAINGVVGLVLLFVLITTVGVALVGKVVMTVEDVEQKNAERVNTVMLIVVSL